MKMTQEQYVTMLRNSEAMTFPDLDNTVESYKHVTDNLTERERCEVVLAFMHNIHGHFRPQILGAMMAFELLAYGDDASWNVYLNYVSNRDPSFNDKEWLCLKRRASKLIDLFQPLLLVGNI